MQTALLFFLATLCAMAGQAEARDKVRIVGSSTVYPFVTLVAEEFGGQGAFPTPVVESTGTGGGFKLFCAGAGEEHPDVSNASRAIKPSEVELCGKNGVKDAVEIKIGYDGIVLANAKKAKPYNLTKGQIFLALAKQVPQDGKLVENHYQTWDQIDPALPKVKIEVYGPPPTSGTRDAFVELVMEAGCEHFPEFKKAYPEPEAYKKQCQQMREDGRFIEAGENDNLIVQKLSANPDALGIFGFSFLDQNRNLVQGSKIEGAAPEFERIHDGSYVISRPLFVYVKREHLALIPGLREFVKELVSDRAMSPDGYLAERGLVPLGDAELKKVRDAAGKL